MRVTSLSIAAVKGTRLQRVEVIELTELGARENRRFFLIDEDDRMVNAKNVGELQTIVSRYDDAQRRLELEFPDGRVISGVIELDGEISARFFSEQTDGRIVRGEWSEAISAHVGKRLRLVEADERGAVDRRSHGGAISLVSRASLERLAAAGDLGELDPRRFRMLIEIDGVQAHGEDAWIDQVVSVGAARIRPRGHVGRCLITSRDPESGVVDVPTLDLLGYRRDADTTEPLPLGVYGEVVSVGVVRVGDPVAVSGE